MRERRVFPVVTFRRFFRRFNTVSRLKQSFAGFFDGRTKQGITAFRVAFFLPRIRLFTQSESQRLFKPPSPATRGGQDASHPAAFPARVGRRCILFMRVAPLSVWHFVTGGTAPAARNDQALLCHGPQKPSRLSLAKTGDFLNLFPSDGLAFFETL